uniref:Variant surface glycoprotein 1125.10 n=1 Tax=Trypanosoma brucei TaxID=5691 RepID=A0A1J0R412_9TRYP|nr:variant surface glycoprotein 1125.10 [Trypanosoma brucei]
MNKKAVVSALVIATLLTDKGCGAANVNVREYEAFCNLFTIISAREALDQLKISEEEPQEHKEIVYYNVSTASRGYYNEQHGAVKKGDDTSTKQATAISWADDKTKIQHLDHRDAPKFNSLKDTPAKAAANAQIQLYLNAADKIKEECTKAAADINKNVDDTKELLATALYGEDTTDLPEASCKGNWAKRCTATATGNQTIANSLAIVFCCICANKDDNQPHCKASITAQWADSRNDDGQTCKAIWGKVKAGCASRDKPGTITPTLLKQGLAGLTSLYGVGTTQGTTTDTLVLGKAGTANCNTGTANSECISLGAYMLEGKGGIRWEQNILAAADKLEAIQTQKQRLNMLKKQLLLLKTQAAAAYALAKQANAAPSPTVATQSPNTTELSAQKEKCKKHGANKSTCEGADKCKWEGNTEKDGMCTVDEGKVTTEKDTTGATERTAGTTTDKCKGKEQKDCKDGCKWEGTECRDSSFLLNKRFARSVVSAAFVALLF